MNEGAIESPRRRYDIALDRAGMALAAGGMLGGLVVAALVLAAGQADPLSLAAAWLLGTLFCSLGITAVIAPVWLVLHLIGLRSAVHAALLGAIAALGVFAGGQTYGFGFFPAPPGDGGSMAMRWISALATSGLLALIAAAIAVSMWRIAYRRRG